MSRVDGMRYAPKGKPRPVVEKGAFSFAAIGLAHGHIYGMCNGLIEAGAALKYVYDADQELVRQFCKAYPFVKAVESESEIWENSDIKLVAGAAVPAERCELGLRCMHAGKDYFTDKSPFTTLEQLALAKEAVDQTKQKYMVYYSERLHVESAVLAGELIKEGRIGRVLQVIGMGPHRLNAATRPAWFFQKDRYGGILCDIGSHQIEQYLYFAGEPDAAVVRSQVANYNHPAYPGLEDFGDASLVGVNGSTLYFRVDWFTPDGLGTWGDGRTFILGTDGYIELRKYTNIAHENTGDHLFLVNHEGEQYIHAAGKVGYPFFGALIMDCLNRTETAMTQTHAFKAAELCMKAQEMAILLAK